MVYSSGAALVSLLLSSITAGAVAQVACDDIDARCNKKAVAPFDQNLDTYYSSADGVTGELLRDSLNAIIRKNYVRYSYTDKCVWKALFEADKDENNPGNVIAIYSKSSIPKLNRDCGKTNQQDNWNKEHVWAKSHGFPKKSAVAYSDLHNLVAADKSVNSKRDTRDFKEGGTNEAYLPDDCVECKQVGSRNDEQYSFEPPDDAKGQVARIMFYMYTRYNGMDATELDLVDRKTFSSDGKGEFGYLKDLLKWHCLKPVTDRERSRNDIIQSWQGNRNPFVDRPEYVEKIWGQKYPSIFEACTPPKQAQVWINEFHYDNVGIDEDEFVEIGCNGAVDVSNYKIFLYGKNGAFVGDKTKVLQGQCTVDTFVFQDYMPNDLVNTGPRGIALVDASGKLLDFISYGGTVNAIDGPVAGSVSIDVGVRQNGSGSKDQSVQLVNKVDAATTCEKTDFEWKLQPRSKGKPNIGQTINCSVNDEL